MASRTRRGTKRSFHDVDASIKDESTGVNHNDRNSLRKDSSGNEKETSALDMKKSSVKKPNETDFLSAKANYELHQQNKAILLSMTLGLKDDEGKPLEASDFRASPYNVIRRGRTQFKPKLEQLQREMQRRYRRLGLPGNPPTSASVSEACDWLVNNPVSQPEEVTFLRKKLEEYSKKSKGRAARHHTARERLGLGPIIREASAAIEPVARVSREATTQEASHTPYAGHTLDSTTIADDRSRRAASIDQDTLSGDLATATTLQSLRKQAYVHAGQPTNEASNATLGRTGNVAYPSYLAARNASTQVGLPQKNGGAWQLSAEEIADKEETIYAAEFLLKEDHAKLVATAKNLLGNVSFERAKMRLLLDTVCSRKEHIARLRKEVDSATKNL